MTQPIERRPLKNAHNIFEIDFSLNTRIHYQNISHQ